MILNLSWCFCDFELLWCAELPPQLLGQRSTSLVRLDTAPQKVSIMNHTSVTVKGHGYVGLVGLHLPRWAPQGHLTNCSAAYASTIVDGEVTLADCLVACLREAKCDGVTVEWTQRHSWPKPASMPWFGNHVQCRLLRGIILSTCATDYTKSHSTITVV